MRKPKRPPELQVITTKNVETITGLLERQARRLMRKIRLYYHKPKRARIVVTEFCFVTGYKVEAVYKYLGFDE